MLEKIFGRWVPWAELPLRVIIGIVYLYHGIGKITGGPANFAGWLGSMNYPAPTFMTWVVIVGEAVGGALILVGFWARYAAVFLILEMLVAMFTVHFKNGFNVFQASAGYEYNLVLIAALLLILIRGPGKPSVEAAFTTQTLGP